LPDAIHSRKLVTLDSVLCMAATTRPARRDKTCVQSCSPYTGDPTRRNPYSRFV